MADLRVFSGESAPGVDYGASRVESRPQAAPAALFRTLRCVWVEVRGRQQVQELARWLLDNRIGPPACMDDYRASATNGYFCGHFLPNDARKIEAWLEEHGVERTPMVVGGVVIEP